MTVPEKVKEEIKDSVSGINPEVLGDVPAKTDGNLFTTVSQAINNLAHEATEHQQPGYVPEQGATTSGITALFNHDEVTDGIYGNDHPAH
ncbi:MAG: RebB family R body protein [Chitinophagaceae bacterium]